MDERGQTLHLRVARERAEHRVPALAVGVSRPGDDALGCSSGLSDVAGRRAVDAGTQFRIGSITKTFTAAVVVKLTQEGVLDLDAPVGRYLPGVGFGRVLLRQVLSHSSGLQREAPLAMWSSMRGPDDAEFLACLGDVEFVDDPGARWHYSNLGYAVLGQVVAAVTGQACQEVIDRELIGPLGLAATTWSPAGSAAVGYRADPYQDVFHPEPLLDQGAIGVGGQLWSTVGDLLVWGSALLGGASEVIGAPVVEAMHCLQVMVTPRTWTQGWGLGLTLDRYGDRMLSGHSGAMPGFGASLSMDRRQGTVAVAFANLTKGPDLVEMTRDLVTGLPPVADRPVEAPVEGLPGPGEMVGVLGRWWSEAGGYVVSWRAGALHVQPSSGASGAWFVREGMDEFRSVRGRLRGERLRILRSSGGGVSGFEWAGYPFSRDPR